MQITAPLAAENLRLTLFINVSIVEEEADESLYWLELLIDSEIVPEKKLTELQKEMNEITAMIVASIKTLRSKQIIQNPKSKIQN